MSAIAFGLERGSLLSPLSSSIGSSDDAAEVERHIELARAHFLDPLSITRVVDEAAGELEMVSAAAADDNWDGYGARPVDARSYGQAVRFLTLLPTLTPTPSVSIDPDGEIAISWDLARSWVFSVSLGRSGRLSYAGLFGSSRSYGTEWLGSEIPKPILDGIVRLYAGHSK